MFIIMLKPYRQSLLIFISLYKSLKERDMRIKIMKFTIIVLIILAVLMIIVPKSDTFVPYDQIYNYKIIKEGITPTFTSVELTHHFGKIKSLKIKYDIYSGSDIEYQDTFLKTIIRDIENSFTIFKDMSSVKYRYKLLEKSVELTISVDLNADLSDERFRILEVMPYSQKKRLKDYTINEYEEYLLNEGYVKID